MKTGLEKITERLQVEYDHHADGAVAEGIKEILKEARELLQQETDEAKERPMGEGGHTELPWRVSGCGKEIYAKHPYGFDVPFVVASCANTEVDKTGIPEANAAFIVEACNTHRPAPAAQGHGEGDRLREEVAKMNCDNVNCGKGAICNFCWIKKSILARHPLPSTEGRGLWVEIDEIIQDNKYDNDERILAICGLLPCYRPDKSNE